jgi:2-methylcitrate dehydratase PrpD
MPTNRRTILRAAAALPVVAGMTSGTAFAQATPAEPPKPSVAPPEATKILAHYIVSSGYDDLPANVRKEGVRTMLNWVGVAIGGSHHQTVDIAASALGPFSGPAQASLLGRKERFDIMNAAFLNGVSSHIFDYDDTHLKTIIHPAGPVASAILALSEMQPVSGKDFLNALVLGVETECRIGNAVYPNHYDVGWHITGTAGVFGAAAATGKLLGLSEQQMIWALGLAASQPVGLRESFGSMNKSFNPGRAASNGIFAALLASKNYTSSDGMIEAKRGWANAISTKQDYRGPRPAVRSRAQYLQALRLRHRAASGDRCGHSVARRREIHDRPDQAGRTESSSAGDRTDRQEDPARRPRRQVQRLSCGGHCADRRRRRRKAIQ